IVFRAQFCPLRSAVIAIVHCNSLSESHALLLWNKTIAHIFKNTGF
ncbi:unnamed protein product, partial [Allacma fusca]